MDAVLTFVIPVGSYHEAIAERAVASVRAQTIPCAWIVIHDTEQKGAGWARNQGLQQIQTPFVSFLDADDWLDPTFAERCLQVYDGAHYVYTDWFGWSAEENGVEVVKQASPLPWQADKTGFIGWHIITTLLPTGAVRDLGGFREDTSGEDTEFYYRLTRNGVCGVYLPEPLFHYGKEGRRSKAWRARPDHDQMMRDLIAPYKGMPMACGDCGENVTDNTQPTNEQQPGDVLVQALWGGNQIKRGMVTGRLYPRTGNGKRLWVSAQDAAAAPHFFKRVAGMPAPISPARIDKMRSFAQSIGDVLNAQTSAPARVEMPVGVTPAPDVANVLRLYAGREGQGDYVPTDFFP